MRPGEVRPDHEHRPTGLRRQERAARGLRCGGVAVRRCCPVRVRALHRVVHQVAGDHGLCASGADAHARVPGVWPGVGSSATRSSPRAGLDEIDEPASNTGFTESPSRSPMLRSSSFDQCSHFARTTRLRAFGNVGTQRPRPSSCSSPRGRRADACTHGVDRLTREARRLQVVEEARAELMQRRQRAVLVVATQVPHDAPALRLHHQRLDQEPQLALRVTKRGGASHGCRASRSGVAPHQARAGIGSSSSFTEVIRTERGSR